jgi:hypothetical protein
VTVQRLERSIVQTQLVHGGEAGLDTDFVKLAHGVNINLEMSDCLRQSPSFSPGR